MNTIQPSVLKKSSIKLAVKVGSHLIYLHVNRESKVIDLTRMALKECKINNPTKMYSVFERANGIDRLISPDQHVYKLLLEWSINQKYELLVKLCRRSSVISKSMKRNCKYAQKIFRIGREKYNQQLGHFKPLNEIHTYEKIDLSRAETELHAPNHRTTNLITFDPILNKLHIMKIKKETTKMAESKFNKIRLTGCANYNEYDAMDSRSTDPILNIFYLI